MEMGSEVIISPITPIKLMRTSGTIKGKDVIIFDLDGTLTPSKSAMDSEMARLVARLTSLKKVAVISGGQMGQFRKQFLRILRGKGAKFSNLFLFPTTATSFYRFSRGGFRRVYGHDLSAVDVRSIRRAFETAFRRVGYEHPEKVYGEIIENRGTQVTFSALGQKIVDVLGAEGIRRKAEWDKLNWRPKIIRAMRPLLKGFEIRSGGLTSIDVTQKGIDKAYGVRQIRDHLGVPIRKMIFVGDRIFPGGNDYEAVKTGIDWVSVSGPAEVKELIRFLLRPQN